jgi:predicted metal-dependent peptidase
MIDKAINSKIVKARAALVLYHPFYASLALRLVIRENPSIPTMATDGTTLEYNSEFVDCITLEELKGCICHEVMHCANQHMLRRGDREMDRWNKACDFAINPIILSSGLRLPKGGLIENGYNGMSAEAIYSTLPNEGKNSGKSKDDSWNIGGVSDPKDDEGKPISSEDKKLLEQNWKTALVQAAQQAKAMGELPAGIERLVDDLVEPVLNWRELLKQFVDSVSKNDYNWMPPNRRYLHAGIVLPSLRSRELRNVVTVLDTSGSISRDELASFESEVQSLVNEYNTNAKVIYCDSEVNDVEDFEAGELIELSMKGGGGTDFRPPFEYLEEEGIEPACLIYQTDGYCDSFPEAPSYPVIWVITSSTYNKDNFEPPFGEVIHL